MALSQNADGNMPVGKAGESHFFIVPSPSEGPAEALRVWGVELLFSQCSQRYGCHPGVLRAQRGQWWSAGV